MVIINNIVCMWNVSNLIGMAYVLDGSMLIPSCAVVLITQVKSQELNSTLHSTIFGLPIAFTNEDVNFTCVIRQSNNMRWTSEQYIGTGGRQLEFASVEPVGSTRTAPGNNQTVAKLISVSDSVIISQLHIRIQSSTFPIASVQCHDTGVGTNASIRFRLAGMCVS